MREMTPEEERERERRLRLAQEWRDRQDPEVIDALDAFLEAEERRRDLIREN